MDDIILVTFKTSQTLIGKLVAISSEQDIKLFVIKEPMYVITQQSKDGNMIGFMPFLDFSEDFTTGISLPYAEVLCFTKPVIGMKNEYNKIFGAGIQIASSMPKI